MHEMSLAESMIEIVEAEAASQGFSKVRTVVLELGALGHVDPQAMLFCFDAVCRGTIAEGAGLEIVTVPGTAWCMDCGKPVAIAARYDPCPDCGGHQLQMTAGTELRIRELVVD
ncbi:MAG TPA: hydrogenase maturation nickel metallochaperone HypA [Hyphomicrobiales bacterium]|nr:hydrogenase maturation nickel metallochaperone HypA [Kaistiaceae bacterium]HQF31176.1 hydrogenase maturation nickel metallochaperone HypA [Hyphomicrobiales bacterium]